MIPNFKDVNKEELEKLVKSEGFDGVLVSRPVVGSGSTGEHSNYADWYPRSSMYYADLYGYWNEATIGVFTPTDAPIVELLEDLYGRPDGSPVFFMGVRNRMRGRQSRACDARPSRGASHRRESVAFALHIPAWPLARFSLALAAGL